jgi:endonuclease/exonuclease/phosphatase family metal-dependent hydrolase
MPLHAVCVHLGLREAQRRVQLQRLCDLATHRIPSDEPLLVAGDFNDWRQRASSALARCGLDEIHSRHLGCPARRYPAFWPLLRLDRIYVRGVRSARPGPPATRLWARLSDHIPLVADVVV